MKWPEKWRGKTWSCGDEPRLTEADLRRVWNAIPLGSDAIEAAARAGRRGMSSRRVDLSLRLLRRIGVVRFAGRKQGWVRCIPNSEQPRPRSGPSSGSLAR